jgi:hypothetical protein
MSTVTDLALAQHAELQAGAGLATQQARAQQLLGQGNQQAVDLSGRGTQQAISQLTPFGGTQAFDEQSALLGALGPEAQRAAIAGIPINEAQQAFDVRQQTGLINRGGGGGSSVLNLQQLGGQQQAGRISNRLSQLSPLAGIEQGTASTISGLGEADVFRRSQLLSGIGGQQAQIRLGQAAQTANARSSAAQLQGLQDISNANRRSQLVGQGAQAAGQFFFPEGG